MWWCGVQQLARLALKVHGLRVAVEPLLQLGAGRLQCRLHLGRLRELVLEEARVVALCVRQHLPKAKLKRVSSRPAWGPLLV